MGEKENNKCECYSISDVLGEKNLQLQIFSYFTIQTLCVISLVCKKWNEYSQESPLWEEQYRLTFGAFQNKVEEISWKKLYSLMNSRYQSSWEAFKEGSFVLIKIVRNNELLYQVRQRMESSVKIVTIAPQSGSGLPIETSMKLNSTRNIGKWKKKIEVVQYKGIENKCAVIESKEGDQTLLSWISLHDYTCVKVLTKTRISSIEHYITSQAIGEGKYVINKGCYNERELRCSIVSTVTTEASTSKVLQEMISYSCKEIPGGSVQFQTSGPSGSSMHVIYASSSTSITLSNCLYYAINSGDVELVKDVWNLQLYTTNPRDIDDYKPLFYACKVSHKHEDPLLILNLLMKLYLFHGRNTVIDYINDKGKSMLHVAASHSNFTVIQYLIENNVSITTLDYKNRSPLSIILKKIHNHTDFDDHSLSFHLSIVELLIQVPNCLVLVENCYILSVIIKLSFNSIAVTFKEKIINWIISLCKSGVNFERNNEFHTLQHLQNPHFDIDIIKTFCYCGVDFKALISFIPKEILDHDEISLFKSDPSFSDLLKRSISNSDVIALKALTARRDVDISALNFFPLIDITKCLKPLEIARLIFQLVGKDSLDLQDEESRTAIHYACINSNLEYVKWLIELGANLNLKDREHNTPLVYCIFSLFDQYSLEKEAILQLMLQKGANPNIKVANSEYLFRYIINNYTHIEGVNLSSLLMLFFEYSIVDIGDLSSSISATINSPFITDIIVIISILILSTQNQRELHRDEIIQTIKENNKFSKEDLAKVVLILNSTENEMIEYFILNNNLSELRVLSRKNILMDSLINSGETYLTFAAKNQCNPEILSLLVDELNFSVELPNKYSYTPLYVAMQHYNLEFAAALLQRKADPNITGLNSPLFYCFSYLFSEKFDRSKESLMLDLISVFIDAGANYDSSWDFSPLHCLMNSVLVTSTNNDTLNMDGSIFNVQEFTTHYPSFTNTLTLILKLQTDINTYNNRNETPLLHLCKSKYLTSTQPINYLLSLGANFHSIDIGLLESSFFSFPDFVQFLVFDHLKINIIVKSIASKSENFANYLLDNYCGLVDLSDHDPSSELTPLIASIMFGLFEITKTLITKYNVDVNQSANKFHQTYGMKALLPIHVACLYSDFETVKLLVNSGANINENLQEYNDLANYPLIITLENLANNPKFNQVITKEKLQQNINIFTFLLDSGASPMLPDKMKKTPMHYAVKTVFAYQPNKSEEEKSPELDFHRDSVCSFDLRSINFTFEMLLGKLIEKGGDINVNEHVGFQLARIIDSNEISNTPLLELLRCPILCTYYPLQVMFNLGAKMLSTTKKPLTFFLNIIHSKSMRSIHHCEQIIRTLKFQYAIELILEMNDPQSITDKLGSELSVEIASKNFVRPSDSLPLPFCLIKNPTITALKLQLMVTLLKIKFALFTDNKRKTALHHAVYSNQAAVRFGIENGLVNNLDANNRIPLHYACTQLLKKPTDYQYTIFTLILPGSNVNHQDKNLNTPLMLLVEKGNNQMHCAAIKLIITRSNVNFALRNNRNEYLLHLLLKNPTLLELLIDSDEVTFPVFGILSKSTTPDEVITSAMDLYVELYEKQPERKALSLQLISFGFRSEGSTTRLHRACEDGDLDMVKALVEEGHPLDIFDSSDRTPVIIALQCNHHPIVSYLTPLVNTTIKYSDDNKNSILHLTAKAGSGSLFFLENGAISVVNSKNKRGDTPLHEACKHLNIKNQRINPLEEITVLLQYGARCYSRNGNGETPLTLAIQANSFDAVKLMLHFSTPKLLLKFINLHTREKTTPVDLAAKINPKIAKYLILRGGSFYTLNQQYYHSSPLKSYFVAPERIHRILDGEKIPIVKAEETALFCFSCQEKFSFLVRKKLCRCCGFYHCKKCTSQKSTIPSLKITQPILLCKYCYNIVISHNIDHYFLSEYFYSSEKKNFQFDHWEVDVTYVEFLPSIKYCLIELSNTIPDAWFEIYYCVEIASKKIWIDLENQIRCIEYTLQRIGLLLTFTRHMKKFHTLLRHCYNYFLKFYLSVEADWDHEFIDHKESQPSIIKIAENNPKVYEKLKKYYSKSQRVLQNQTVVSQMGRLIADINYDIINYSYSPELEPLKLRLTILSNFLNRFLSRRSKTSIEEDLEIVQSLFTSIDPIIPRNLKIAHILFADYFMMEMVLSYYENSNDRLKGEANIEQFITNVHEKIDLLITEFPEVNDKKRIAASPKDRIRIDHMVNDAKRKLVKLDEAMFTL